MTHIATLTLNPTVDKSCDVDEVAPERKLRCGRPHHDPGGGGVNVVRAIHHLGGEATALWTCGGPIGQLLRNLLDREGVDHRPVQVEDMTRENLIVFDESTEQQYRFGMPGPILSRDEIERCLQEVRELDPPADYLVLSGSLPPETDEDLYAQAARQAPRNCRTIIDTSGAALKRSLEAPVYLIKPNVRELGQLAGREVEGDREIMEVSRQLIESGKVEVVLTSLGSGGAVLVTADSHEHIRSPTVKIRSKVGAGDSTVAGVVLGLARGLSISDAARFGVAAGAAAVMTEGTTLCRRADAERLYEQMQSFDSRSTSTS